MQSANQNRNVPSGSTVPMVQPVPVYKALQTQTVVEPSEKPSSVPIVTEAPTFKSLETQTTPGASLLPTPIALTANVGGAGTYVSRGSATPNLTKQTTYKPLASQTNPGASIVPIFTQSQAIAPVANYINKDTTFWSASQGGGSTAQTSTFSTLYASSLTAGFASISTLNNSTINVNTIDIDGQILTADSDQLFLNGLPIATTANISSIADWALYDSVSTVRMMNHDITEAKDIYANTVSTSLTNTSSLGFYDALGFTLGAYQGTFVIVDSDTMNATTINSTETVNTSSINTDTIYSYDLRLVSSIDGTGDGVLTVSSDGNTLFFNGSSIAQQAQISSIGDWALTPAVSTVNLGTHNIYSDSTIRIQAGSANQEKVIVTTELDVGGSLYVTGNVIQSNTLANNQFNATSIFGTNGILPTDQFANVTIHGGNIPVPLAALAVEGGVTLDAGFGLHGITAGCLKVAGINTQRIDIDPTGIGITSPTFITMNGLGAGNLTMGGAVAIGAGSYVTLEHGAGLGSNAIFVQDTARDADARLIFAFGGQILGTDNISTAQIVSQLGNFSTINTTSLRLQNIYASSIQTSSIVGNVGSFSTINTTSLDLQNLTASSIQVSSIVGNVGAFSTLLTNASTIRLGAQPGVGPALGNNSVGIGYNSQPFGINAVAIGSNAGNEGGPNSISLGQGAGVLCGSNCINIGKGANGIFGGSGTITLNGTSSNLNPVANDSCYIKPLRNVSTQPGGTTFAMGYTNTTGECVATNTKVSEIESTIKNTSQITYDTGLLTTTIDGILKINGSATATQSLTANTSFNSLQVANLSSLTLNGIPLSSFTNTLLYDSTTKVVSYFPTSSVIPTVAVSQNVFYVAKGGSDTTGNGQSYNPYLTIQKAIDMCPVGSQDVGQTIYIMPGLYVENLTIADKNINFRGSGDTNHTYNTTIRGNMTITSSNTNRSYRTVSFQFVQIQNYTATTGVAITLSTSGTGKGKLILTSCYVIGASTGVSLLSAIASNCDWLITMDATRFYTGLAYSAPLIDISGASTTAVGLTMNNCVAEYESPSGSTNSIIKVSGYAGMTLQYCTITQPLNVSLNNSALTNGLIWVNNVPNTGVVATSTNGVNVGTTLCFSGTQATLGVNGTPAMFISRGCPSVYVLTGTMSVRSNSTPATHCITGSTSAGTKTIVYYATGTLITTIGTANKIDNTNCTTTILTTVTG